MTTVTREQFKSSFGKGVDASAASATKLDAVGVDGKKLLEDADVDKNGVVAGEHELERLWKGIDDFDRNGWRSSVSDAKPLAILGALVPRTTTPTPTPATTTPTPTQTPLEVALAALSAAEDGGVSGNEIDSARAKVAARYGDRVADAVMKEGLGLKLSSLDASGVDWVQRHHGSMEGKIDRYQAALRTHLKDAKLIDANFDGKLDAGDKLWTRDASGRVDVKSIEPALLDRVKIGGAFIGAAEAMDGASHDFALIKDHSFNAKYWTPMGGGTFAVKPGVRPSVAFDDIFAHPEQYKFECATALVITQYKAMRDLLGKNDFDRVVKNLQIGPWQSEDTLDSVIHVSGRGDVEASVERKATLRAGDYGYFNNWDVSDQGREEGWQGENVIYLGDGRFYGHPFGIADEKTIVEHLNGQRKEGSTRSASFLELRSQMGAEILREDKVEG